MESVLKVTITKDDSALKEILKSLADMQAMAGGSMPEAFRRGQDEINRREEESEAKRKQREQERAAREAAAIAKREEQARKQAEAIERADKAAAESTLKYAQLKAQYETKSLDQVRDGIMKGEETARTLRRARADEEDKFTKAELQRRTNQVQTELQLFRSLEKEKIGRTFSEQLERLNLEEKTSREVIALLHHQAEEFEEIQKKMTVTQNAEEKKRLQEELTTLKAENAAVKNEAEHRGISTKPEEHHGGGISLGQVEGLAVAAEGLTTLVEKSKEVVAAQHQLQVGTGLSGEALKKAGEEAEELGDKLGVSGDEAKTTMGKVSSYTHATGEELNKQTEAVIAYAQAHGKSAEMVAKKLSTASGQAEIFAEATTNVGKAQEAANEPAIRAQLTQAKLEETAGELASVLLQGLAPILTQLTPLIGTVGGILASVLTPAMKVLSVVLDPLIAGLNFLKPILPELVIGIGALTIAFNAGAISAGILNAVLAVNPFVLIGIAIVALIGIVVELVKHWDDVIATLKNVADTVMNAAGSVLSFLGITNDASAATKKHTESLKENKKSLEDIKKAEEDAKKATEDYTTSLKLNQEEQEKSAKEGQDNAIAAIVDIKKRLRTATGEEKAMLSQRLAQWQEYGKGQVASQEELDKQKHEAALAIGAAVDNEDKSAQKKQAKATKDAYTARKDIIDEALNAERLLVEQKQSEGLLSDSGAKAAELQAQLSHDKDMLLLAEQFKKDKKAATSAIFKDEEALRKLAYDTAVKDEQNAQSDVLAALSDETERRKLETMKRGLAQSMEAKILADIEKQSVEEQYKIKKASLEKNIEAAKANNQSTEDLDRQLIQLNGQRNAELVKQDEATAQKRNAIQREAAQSSLQNSFEARKLQIENAKAYGASIDGIMQAEEGLALKQEEARYQKDLEDRAADIADATTGYLIKQSLEQNHQNKLLAIQQKAAQDKRRVQEQEISFLIGPLAGAFSKAGDTINQKYFQPLLNNMIAQKTFFGGLVSEIVTGLVKTATTYISQRAAQVAADLIFGSTATAAATAEAAVTSAAWTPAAISASVATLGGADAVGGSAFAAAQAAGKALTIIPHAEGGLSLASEFFPMANGVLGLRGEASPELHLPLNHPKTEAAISNAFGAGLAHKLDMLIGVTSKGLNAVHSATMANGGDTVLNSYGVQVGARQQQSILNKRKVV